MRQLRAILCPPSRSIYRRKLFLLRCRLTHHLSSSPPSFLPSPSHVTSVNRRDDASGQNKAAKSHLCIPVKTVFPLICIAQGLAESEGTTPFPLSLSGASRCFGALHWSSKHPRNSPSPLLIRVRSLNCMLAYIRRQLSSFLTL